MIQRIQTAFLLIAIGLQAMLFKVNFYSLKIDANDAYYSAWQSINIGSNEIHINVIHIILQFALIGVTLYTIFLFKYRKQQMKLCLYLVLGTILSLLFSLYNLFTTNYSEYHFGFGTYLISILVILYISSYFFIKKDDDMVKSADRLR
jgi:hypothetical protein